MSTIKKDHQFYSLFLFRLKFNKYKANINQKLNFKKKTKSIHMISALQLKFQDQIVKI